jgi:pyruvate,orthophosphate dikinase
MTVDGIVVREGDWITLDGSTGRVMLGAVPTIDAEVSGEFGAYMAIVDRHRRLKVRANADIPRDALKAREFGAEGIGLCRTEHMFFAEERLPQVVRMILAAPLAKALKTRLEAKERALDGAGAAEAKALKAEIAALRRELAGPAKDYLGALAKLLPFQRADFRGLFKAMNGYPVTIRTLDPPLHEFLPKREQLMVEIATLRATNAKKNARQIASREKLLRAVEELHEFNPMLGHRGCRLGITYPEMTRMQARAIFEAALSVSKGGTPVKPEVMIPLVGHVEELKRQKAIVLEEALAVLGKNGSGVEYLIGTMIEVPRGALTADEIAKEADFFSFGTNDLTQMCFGLSRDDAGRFLAYYIDHGLLDKDPFVSLDAAGVGQLVEIGVEKGRKARPGLKIGVCGEHGGDPASIHFFHKVGLDYVSCSPYRVPIARLAAAQAQLEKPVGD